MLQQPCRNPSWHPRPRQFAVFIAADRRRRPNKSLIAINPRRINFCEVLRPPYGRMLISFQASGGTGLGIHRAGHVRGRHGARNDSAVALISIYISSGRICERGFVHARPHGCCPPRRARPRPRPQGRGVSRRGGCGKS